MLQTRVVWLAPIVLLSSACAFDEEGTGVGGTLPQSTTAQTTSGGSTTSPLPTTGSSSDGSSSSTTTTTSTTGEPPTTGTTSSTGAPGSSSSEPGSSTTAPPPPSCEDQLQNQDETDVDCGGSCSPCPDGQGCNLPGDCLSGLCEAGLCAPPECLADQDCAAMGDACNAATCDAQTKKCAVTPANDGEACDDGDPCTLSSTCNAGVCEGAEPINCATLDSFCGVGFCDPQTGQCVVKAKDGMDGQPCDDGFVCTPDDVCEAGKCGAGGPGYLLFEDFADAAPGWNLGPTWQVGKAKPSQMTVFGADPSSDRSPTDDDRLAGVVIGGLSQGGAQAKSCLTSPPVDTTLAKSAYVTLWRNLHTEYFPFVLNQIEVFDGIEWVELEAGYNFPGVNDANWQQVFFELTDYSNEALRVRICYTRTDGADSFPGWSVDDITIGPYACTPE